MHQDTVFYHDVKRQAAAAWRTSQGTHTINFSLQSG